MGTPDDVIGQSTLYMRIYFAGMPFFMLYNYGAAILRAVGDTKRPIVVPDRIRCCQCVSESFSRYCFSSGRCRSGNCNCYLRREFPVRLCFAVCNGHRQVISYVSEILRYHGCYVQADFPGRTAGGNPEHSY